MVRGLARDHDGSFWVGTFGGGLNRYDPRSGTFTHFRHDAADPSSLSDDLIWTVYVDRDNVVWVGTDKGFSTGSTAPRAASRAIRPPDADGAGYRDPRRSMRTGTGALWIGSNGGGLSRFDRADRALHDLPLRPGRPAQPEP